MHPVTEFVENHGKTRFPWALAAIDISAQMTALVRKYPGKIGNALFAEMTTSEDVLRTFDELFGLVFLEFEEFYSTCIAAYLQGGGNPALSIFEYNTIRQRFFDELYAQVLPPLGIAALTLCFSFLLLFEKKKKKKNTH